MARRSRPGHRPEAAECAPVGRALAAEIAGDRELPPELLARIIERTDGNPLYVEEFTRAVLENHGRLDLEQHAASLTVPSTLQASLMARLDRLGPARDLAQVCAAIGRSFTYELVAAVAELGDGNLRGSLNDLVRSEILTPQRASSMAATTYSFKHALLREAAYSSMLKSRRRGIHARVAQAIESVFPELAEEQPELLAHHHGAAGERRRAADYLLKASRMSLGRSAAVEAAKHARDGLALLAEEGGGTGPTGDAGAAALHLAHGRALIILKGEHAAETGPPSGARRPTPDRIRRCCSSCSTDSAPIISAVASCRRRSPRPSRSWRSARRRGPGMTPM